MSEDNDLEGYLRSMLQDFESDSEKVKPIRQEFVLWCKEKRKRPSEAVLEEFLKSRFYGDRNSTNENDG